MPDQLVIANLTFVQNLLTFDASVWMRMKSSALEIPSHSCCNFCRQKVLHKILRDLGLANSRSVLCTLCLTRGTLKDLIVGNSAAVKVWPGQLLIANLTFVHHLLTLMYPWGWDCKAMHCFMIISAYCNGLNVQAIKR